MTVDEQLTIDLWILDAILTEKDPRGGRGDINKLVEMSKFAFGEMHYLSDGGYSRIFINVLREITELCLTSNSRDEVKRRWHQNAAQQVILRIEQRVEAYIESLK